MNLTLDSALMEDKLQNVPLSKKKQIMKQFKLDFLAKKKQTEENPIHIIKNEYHKGNLSAFAAQDLVRLYEVLNESKNVLKLKSANRRRI